MSLAERAVRIVEAAARAEGAHRVRAVTLEIGRLAAVDPAALAFGLEVAARGTLAEGAAFRLVDVAGAGRCASCGREAPMATSYEECPDCRAGPLQIVRGSEMRVRDIEVD